MPSKTRVIEDLDFVSNLISERARTLAIGVLAVCWVFVLANATSGDEANLIRNSALIGPIILALLALLSDLGQYWCGYVATRRHLLLMEKKQMSDVPYDYTNAAYRWRAWLFYMKLLLMMTGVLWLLINLGITFFVQVLLVGSPSPS